MAKQKHVDEQKMDKPADEPPAQEPQAAAAEDLQQLLEDARAKADENWDKLLRAQAELENLRKRTVRDVENAHKYALEKFAGELLGVRDSLEMGVDAASTETDPLKLKEGSELTLKMLVQVMDKFGIKEVNPQGDKFDPELHQAMTLQENAELPPNTVITVMQKGYILNDRLVRPAMVIVSKAPQGASS